MNFFLGAQNFVDCLRRHTPKIQIPKMIVTVPVAAIIIEDRETGLTRFAEILGTNATINDGTITTPTFTRCTTNAVNIVKPCVRNLNFFLNP